jgi:hypothetical protein
MVNGARFLKGHCLSVPKYRRLGQEILTLATNMTADFKTKVNDSQSGFRAFASNTFGTFTFTNNGMGIESEMLANATGAGLRIKEVPITCRYDVAGSTFNPFRHGFSVLNSIVNQFQRKHPLLYFGVPGFVCFVLGLMLALKTLQIFQSNGGFAIGTALSHDTGHVREFRDVHRFDLEFHLNLYFKQWFCTKTQRTSFRAWECS